MASELPLLILVAIWIIERLNRPPVYRVDPIAYRKLLWEIQDRIKAPESRAGFRLYRWVLGWIHRELEQVETLMEIGLVAVGRLPKGEPIVFPKS